MKFSLTRDLVIEKIVISIEDFFKVDLLLWKNQSCINLLLKMPRFR